MTLHVLEEEDRGAVLIRWVRAPAHLVPDCKHGEVDVMLVSTPTCGLWSPAMTVLPDEREAGIAEAYEHGAEPWERGVAAYSAAFGLEWERLTVTAIRGLFVLLDALEEPTVRLLHALDPEKLLQMRLAAPDPANVLRNLRLMRSYAAATQ